MSVFTHPFYTVPDSDYGNFGSLVRFIDDWEKHISRPNERGQGSRSRRTAQSFTPRFDVRETDQAYELHGELPGIEKKDISIEFSDNQTIVVRGNIERSYTEGNVPAGLLETTSRGAITNEPQTEEQEAAGKSPRATAEGGEAKAGAGEEQTKASSESQQKAKYWVYERSVGNFSRSFTFSGHVDHDNVSASLENGILTVIVPKAKKPEARRITVN